MGRHKSRGGHGDRRRPVFETPAAPRGHGASGWSNPSPQGHGATPRVDGGAMLRRPPGWALFGFALVGAIVWSALAWALYGGSDAIIGWLSTNTGGIVQAGKDAATAAGVGKEIVGAVTSAPVAGAADGVLTFVKAIARPAIVVVWLLGMVAILAAPFFFGRLAGRFGRPGH